MESCNNDEYLGGLFDCYVITKQRDMAFIVSFLDRFIPSRKETADEYEFPQYSSSPQFLFSTATQLMTFMEKMPFEPHSIYWANEQGCDLLTHCMCFYTDDGFLILGGSCRRKLLCRETMEIDMTYTENFLQELKDFAKSEHGFITLEEPPPCNIIEFLKSCQAGTAWLPGPKNRG